jgi:hypothetical protein
MGDDDDAEVVMLLVQRSQGAYLFCREWATAMANECHGWAEKFRA